MELQPFHDILGRSLRSSPAKHSALSDRADSGALQMTETAFHTGEENAPRLAEALPPILTGEKIQLFNMLEKPVMESGAASRVHHHGLCAVLPDAAQCGTLDGAGIIGRKTLELMASNHLGPTSKSTRR